MRRPHALPPLTRPAIAPLLAGLLLAGTAVGQTAPRTADAAKRPAPAAARAGAFSPAVEAVLVTWYRATKDIQRLEGGHTEIQYAKAFAVETRRHGQFFYEAPDRGRIDLEPVDVEGLKAGRNGYQLQAGSPERWICDGKGILRIDDQAKEVTPMPIPADQQGANIMDGPLPFLLGMPPEKVRRRFRVTLHRHGSKPGADVSGWLRDPKTTVMLDIRPRLAQDAQNWERAEVQLTKPTFLPAAVQLTSQGGGQSTVYKFEKLKVNSGRLMTFIKGDPFKPDLRGYKTAQFAAEPGTAPAAAGVPSVVGYHYEKAQRLLATRGYKAKFMHGPIAPNGQLTYRALKQKPEPGEPLPAGGEVAVWLYKPAAVKRAGAEK